jgi:hypothetical protein
MLSISAEASKADKYEAFARTTHMHRAPHLYNIVLEQKKKKNYYVKYDTDGRATS